MPNIPSLNNDYPVITRSEELFNRAKDIIPSLTQTLAKGPSQHSKGAAPVYLGKGKGSHVWDVDGNEYIDFSMGIGPVSLGYCYDDVDNAIMEQIKNGITFSLMHPLEVEVAELITSMVPNAEAVRYSKTGAEVTSAAIRLARAYTGRNKILCCGYHGWHDWYISVTDRNRGIPLSVRELTFTFNYNDIDSLLNSIDEDTAGVILEPMVFEEPTKNFLQEVRRICSENGVILIFDEMWTGFRLAAGGAQEYFKVDADLACFSKAVANGMPLSLLTGKKVIMDLLEKDVFFYTTFGGETLSLAAAKAVIKIIKSENVPAYLSTQGKKLKDGLNKLFKEADISFLNCIGHNCRTMVTYDALYSPPLEIKTLLQQELIRCGILWSGIHNICYSHNNEDIDFTLAAYKNVLPVVRKAVHDKNIKKYLRGEILEPVFRKTSQFNIKPKLVH